MRTVTTNTETNEVQVSDAFVFNDKNTNLDYDVNIEANFTDSLNKLEYTNTPVVNEPEKHYSSTTLIEQNKVMFSLSYENLPTITVHNHNGVVTVICGDFGFEVTEDGFESIQALRIGAPIPKKK